MTTYLELMGEAVCISVAITTGMWLVGWVLDEIERR